MNARHFLCALTLLSPLSAFAADAFIRLSCEEEDKGSDVLLDGEYKGKCPIDLSTKPGNHRLEVATKKDGKYQLVYDIEVPLGSGVAQRIEMPRSPTYPTSPEWVIFFTRNTPFPTLMRNVVAGSPVAKAELALNYLADPKGCYFAFKIPEEMHPAIRSWSGACKGSLGTGPGELVWSASGIPEYGRQTGNFVQGKLEGKGKRSFHNGEVYEGTFVGGQQRGPGVKLFSNGDRYEGDFQDWQTTVKGVLVKKSGERYEGEFKGGKMNGKGVLTSADGNRQAGIFQQDKFVGPE